MGGDLSPLPSCCLLATPSLLEGNLTFSSGWWGCAISACGLSPCSRLWHMSSCSHMGTSWTAICPVSRQRVKVSQDPAGQERRAPQETAHASLGNRSAPMLPAGQSGEPLPGITRLTSPGKRTRLARSRPRRLNSICYQNWSIEREAGSLSSED